jgi:Tol biopolymer transport system component
VQLHAEAGEGGPAADTTIKTVDLESGTVSTIVRARLPKLVQFPSWSADGRFLVYEESRFTDDRPSSSALVVTALGGRDSRRLTDPAMFASYPDWSPTDDRIAFITYDLGAFPETTHTSNLFTIRADGSELRQVTHEKPDGARVGQPSWTPDGREILVTVLDGDTRRLAFVTPSTGERADIPDVDATHGRLGGTAASLSMSHSRPQSSLVRVGRPRGLANCRRSS